MHKCYHQILHDVKEELSTCQRVDHCVKRIRLALSLSFVFQLWLKILSMCDLFRKVFDKFFLKKRTILIYKKRYIEYEVLKKENDFGSRCTSRTQA